MHKNSRYFLLLLLVLVTACGPPAAVEPPTPTLQNSDLGQTAQSTLTFSPTSMALQTPAEPATSTSAASPPMLSPTPPKVATATRAPTVSLATPKSEATVARPQISATPLPAPCPTPDRPLLDVGLSANAHKVERLAKFELTFVLPTAYDNPFNPDVVAVQGRFLAPDGTMETIPGFYYQEVEHLPDQYDKYEVTTGPGVWKVRYAPRQTGPYSYRVELCDAQGCSATTWHELAVLPSAHPGLLAIDPAHPSRLVLGGKVPFVARGTNLAWQNNFATYQTALEALHNNGGNLARVWIDPHWAEFLLEWQRGTVRYTDNGPTEFDGLGRYNQEAAWRLDRLFEWAEESDVYLMLTVWNFLAYWQEWPHNPYNSENGGPLDTPLDVWSGAYEPQQNLLRYIVARWGYSPRLALLELWNEADNQGVQSHILPEVAVQWHNDMYSYVQTLFPGGRLVTTSFAWTDHAGQEQHNLWPYLELPVVNSHLYGAPQDLLASWGKQFAVTGGKDRPFFLGEFSIESEALASQDPEARFFHLGLWAPVFVFGASGVNMMWRQDMSFLLPPAHSAQLEAFASFLDPALSQLTAMRHYSQLDATTGIRAGGYLGKEKALVWCYNEAAYWNEPDNSIEEVDNGVLTLPNMVAGSYSVEYWHPVTGQILSSAAVEGQGDGLRLELPPFRRDLAVKVHRDSTQAKSSGIPTSWLSSSQ